MAEAEDKTEFLFKILDKNLYWVSAADTKGTILFSIKSAMLAVLASLVPSINLWTISTSIFTTISLLGLLSGVAFIILAQFPRLKGPRNSLIFFGGISSHDEQDYVAKITSIPLKEMIIDLAKQCHRNGEIAKTKYGLIKNATFCLFASLPFWLISIWLLYPLKFVTTK